MQFKNFSPPVMHEMLTGQGDLNVLGKQVRTKKTPRTALIKWKLFNLPTNSNPLVARTLFAYVTVNRAIYHIS